MNHIFLSMRDKNFVSFRVLCKFLGVCVEDTTVKMQSMTVSGQFNYAMMMSIMGGLVLSSPYIFYQIWSFVKPGLKVNEMKAAKGIVFLISVCFLLGIAFGYFVVAPLTITFFGSFQISTQIENNFTIGSYMGTIISTVFYTGLLFLLPIASFFLTHIGLITPDFLKKYRRHAIVVILIISAIPIIILYEVGILFSKRAIKKRLRE